MSLSALSLIDLILASFLFGFVLVGFWLGLIHMVGAVIGVIAGALVAGHLYQPVAGWLLGLGASNENLMRVVAFLALFLLTTRLVGLIFSIVNKVFKIIAIIPFLKTFNRLLGAVLGLIEGLLIMGLVVYFASRFPFGPAFELALRSSWLAKLLFTVGKVLAPLLPEAVRMMQPVIT
jgi:membrane protein required for colicin V production